jgi:glycosyltransferase involved in cell wall biosynthesis
LVYWTEQAITLHEPVDYTRWVRLVNVSVSPSRPRHTVMFLDYLRRRARDLDVLLVYHLTSESLFNLSLYKALNPRGVAVLKLDMDHRALAGFEQAPLLSKRGALMRLFATTPLDFCIIETESMGARLRPHFERMGHPLHVLPIGVDCSDPVDIDRVLATKEKLVLTAGRLGMEQKNAELLLDAMERLPEAVMGDWMFWFVGTRTPEFDTRLADFKRRRPELAARLVVKEFISSREELSALYQRARIFCLTSRWESFGLVLGEAAWAGCYLVSTDIGAAPELTKQGRHGQLVPNEDAGALARALERVMTGKTPTADSARWAHHHVKEQFSWPAIARRLGALVEQHRRNR